MHYATRAFLLAICCFAALVGQEVSRAQAGLPDPYEILKLSSSKGREFFDAVQRAVRTDDRSALASMVRYPLVVFDESGRKRQIVGKSQLLKDPGLAFDEHVKQAILCQAFESIMVSSKGVMFGNGTLWADVSPSGEGLEIVTLNRRAARSVACAGGRK